MTLVDNKYLEIFVRLKSTIWGIFYDEFVKLIFTSAQLIKLVKGKVDSILFTILFCHLEYFLTM